MAPKKPSVAASTAAHILVRQSNRIRGISPEDSSLPARNKKATVISGLQKLVSEEPGTRVPRSEEDKGHVEQVGPGSTAEENRPTSHLFPCTNNSDTDDSFRSVNEFDNIEVIIEENSENPENITVGLLENNGNLEEPKREITELDAESTEITERGSKSLEETKVLNSGCIVHIINSDSEMPNEALITPKLKLPNPFSAADHEDAEVWFENFCRIAESYKWDGEEIVNHFSELLTGTARKWWKFRKADNDDTSWEAITADFLKTFCNIGNTSLAMEALLRRTHRSEEDFRKYFFDVFDLCDKVDHEMSDEQRIFYLSKPTCPRPFSQQTQQGTQPANLVNEYPLSECRATEATPVYMLKSIFKNGNGSDATTKPMKFYDPKGAISVPVKVNG